MSSEIPDNFYSDGECHMARISDAVTFIERRMVADGKNPDAITFDSIFASAQSKNTNESKLTYPWMDKEWPTMNIHDKIKILDELIGPWLDDKSTILYTDKVANGGIICADEIERQQLVSGAETRAAEALDRMNANGYFNRNEQ